MMPRQRRPRHPGIRSQPEDTHGVIRQFSVRPCQARHEAASHHGGMLLLDAALTNLLALLPTELAQTHLSQIDWRDVLLILLTPFFLGFVALEWWALRQRSPAIYQWKDSLTSLNLGGVYTLVDIAFVFWVVLPAMDWVWHQRLMDIEITPWTFAVLYLGVELCYYVFHRASHRVRWFWCAHVVHHGSEHMNFTTAMRQSWLYGLSGNWLFYLPMVWLGFEPRWVLLALSCNLAYQFFIHTQWLGRLPAWMEWIFNTPSHHRAHHGRNERYLDRNYGGTLIVFDRLFGTFVPETEKVAFGLVHPVKNQHPVWLTLHEWVAMFGDMAQPGPWPDRLKHLWKPPHWRRTRDNPPHASERPHRPHDATRP